MVQVGMTKRGVLATVAALAPLAGLGGPLGIREAAGVDFRIENRVYVGGRQEPQVHSTTMFYGGLIYDFLDQPAEAVVFDKAGGRFSLLDFRRRVAADLSAADVAAFVTRIREQVAHHPDPWVRFLAEPALEERMDGAALVLSGEWLTYRARLAEASPAVARQYREFSDWYAELNTVLHPTARPPFARLRLDEALACHQATAREVELTTTSKKGVKTTIHSRHELATALTPADLKRIAEAREAQRTFQTVKFEEYHKGAGE
jgi:hypothetical protein